MGLVGIFTLSGDLIKLKCSCGATTLTINRSQDGKIRLTVPCLVCPNPHTYTLSGNVFYEKELFTLACTYTGLDICFIGTEEKVSEALEESERELEKMIADTGVDMMTDKDRDFYDDVEDEDDYVDPMIVDMIRFIISDLAEEKKILCNCPAGAEREYRFEFCDEGVCIYCTNCGGKTIIPIKSLSDANEFLRCDSLDLK